MKSWELYNDKADSFFESYVSIKFEDIFHDVYKYIPSAGSSCLDIGAGSGRDAAALTKMGLSVTAVEPSVGMRLKAMKHHESLPIKWIDDSLPRLGLLQKLSLSYDFILMSAVWMHLSSNERQEALLTTYNLLKSKGTMILTLRLGPAEPDRMIYKISTEEALAKAKNVGFEITYINPIKSDGLNRGDVQWQIIVLSKP